jgi:hypothetical protein
MYSAYTKGITPLRHPNACSFRSKTIVPRSSSIHVFNIELTCISWAFPNDPVRGRLLHGDTRSLPSTICCHPFMNSRPKFTSMPGEIYTIGGLYDGVVHAEMGYAMGCAFGPNRGSNRSSEKRFPPDSTLLRKVP